MSLADQLGKSGNAPQGKRSEPLWKGPEKDGITFSMLAKFLVCRERFRIAVIEGLRPVEQFNHRIEYGNMWHICEEQHAARLNWLTSGDGKGLQPYCRELCKKYPLQQEHIEKWFQVCKLQFPLYVDYWSKHPDVTARTPLLQEQVFNVSYRLLSGRTVRLRGKWDSVDLIGEGKGSGVYLQENKSKGDIDELQIKRQLSFDLQTMMYLVSLEIWKDTSGLYEKTRMGLKNGPPILGVRYNVIRRPLSGGKGTIVQKKGSKNVPAETTEHYYARLAQYIKDEPETYFMRWKVEVTPQDIAKFREQCLDPILEQLCDWYDWVESCHERKTNPSTDWKREDRVNPHFRMPFGVYSPLLDGGSTDLDSYLVTGSMLGLQRTDKLFTELT